MATDNHLGYLENDAVRGMDSFTTFKEILEIANAKNVIKEWLIAMIEKIYEDIYWIAYYYTFTILIY